MKRLTFVSSIAFVFMIGCQLLNADETATPYVKVEPVLIIAGQEFEIKVTISKEIIMPYCGSITYDIEKLESEVWVVVDGQHGICNGLLLPEIPISESVKFNQIIEEEGVYRFKSSYKFNNKDQWKPLYSDTFKIEAQN